MINKSTMRNSFCIWTEVDLQEIQEQIPQYISQSGSQYFYLNDGVYRLSDHWGRAANSKWRLTPMNNELRKVRLGFANFTDFHKDNLHEKLYFIEVDFKNQLVFFNHKNNKKPNCMAILRTATETTKSIRKIRKLIENQSWTRHFVDDKILEKVILEIINTDRPVLEIKKMFL